MIVMKTVETWNYMLEVIIKAQESQISYLSSPGSVSGKARTWTRAMQQSEFVDVLFHSVYHNKMS